MQLKISTFDEFVRFFFCHEVDVFTEEDAEEPLMAADPRAFARWYQQLFATPGFLAVHYSRLDIDHGFAAMINPNVPLNVPAVMWDGRIPYETRAGIVDAMFYLYRDLFDHDPLFGTPFMWWDPIAYDFECGKRQTENGGDSQGIQDRMFATLTAILALPSLGSQRAALHGLGHLHHPRTQDVISEYVARNPDLPADVRQYAAQSAAGLIT